MWLFQLCSVITRNMWLFQLCHDRGYVTVSAVSRQALPGHTGWIGSDPGDFQRNLWGQTKVKKKCVSQKFSKFSSVLALRCWKVFCLFVFKSIKTLRSPQGKEVRQDKKFQLYAEKLHLLLVLVLVLCKIRLSGLKVTEHPYHCIKLKETFQHLPCPKTWPRRLSDTDQQCFS